MWRSLSSPVLKGTRTFCVRVLEENHVGRVMLESVEAQEVWKREDAERVELHALRRVYQLGRERSQYDLLGFHRQLSAENVQFVTRSHAAEQPAERAPWLAA